MARQGNTTAIGLGWTAHQKPRLAAIRAMPDGTPCPLCRQPMHADKTRNWDRLALHYDHVVARAISLTAAMRGPKRLTHAICNVKAGSVTARQVRHATPRPRAKRSAYTRW